MRKTGIQDMTQGNILLHFVRFTLPLLFGYLFQMLYNTVDSAVVGRFVGDAALTAVGLGFPVILLNTSLFSGICTGSTVVISQFLGANRTDKVKESIETSYATLLYVAIPATLLCLGVSWPLLKLLNTSEAVFDVALTYVLILGLGVFGSIGYNLNSAILQGLGNSRPTILFLLASSVTNVILDLVFVLCFHWGVAGVALATIIAQLLSFIIGYCYIRKRYPDLTCQIFHCRFNKALFKDIFRIGIPQGLQNSLAAIVTFLMVSEINRYGDSYAAGYNIGSKVENFAFYFIMSVSMAATSFTGQNIGAGKLDRVKKGARVSALLSAGWPLFTFLIVYAFRYPIASLFTTNPEIIESSVLYISFVYPSYIFFGLFFSYNAVLRGTGESVFPLISALVGNLVLRYGATLLLSRLFGIRYMFLGYSFGYLLAAVLSSSYYFSGRWKRHGSIANK